MVMQATMQLTEPIDRFLSLQEREPLIRELANVAQEADAAHAQWLAYRGDDVAEDERLHDAWQALRSRYKAMRNERWHLLESSEVLPDYAG
jgi:cation transport regulator ChaB